MKSKLDSIPLFNDVISIDKQHKKYRPDQCGIVEGKQGEDKLDPKG